MTQYPGANGLQVDGDGKMNDRSLVGNEMIKGTTTDIEDWKNEEDHPNLYSPNAMISFLVAGEGEGDIIIRELV